MITNILLALVLVAIIVLIVLIVIKFKRIKPNDVKNTLSDIFREADLVKNAGTLRIYAQDIRNDYRSLDRMLRVPKEKADLGEISLETILSDQLPPDMFGIRKTILDGKIPDAHIRSTVGEICIDSKFPLDNYKKMIEANDAGEKESYKKEFLTKNLPGHLKKIANDYVCPEKGSAEFAFAYISSESIYYFLVTEAYEMLRDYTKKGVQVVSPLTLSHKIELIKANVHAKKLSENAEKVKDNLIRLSKQFNKIDEIWRVFYTTHFKDLKGKAEELDGAYKKLREEFERVSKVSEEE